MLCLPGALLAAEFEQDKVGVLAFIEIEAHGSVVSAQIPGNRSAGAARMDLVQPGDGAGIG